MENKISLRQLQALIIVNTFGVMAVFLPQLLAEITPETSWIWVIVGGVGAAAVGAMAVTLNGSVLYKSALGRIICILLCGKIILCAGIWLRMFSATISSLLLEKTPTALISGIMALLCLYIAFKGIETRARTAEILFFIVVIILVFVFLLSAYNMEVGNLIPLSIEGGGRASWSTAISVFGIEYLLFINPFLNKDGLAPKRAFSAGLLCAVLLGITVLLTTAVFGAEGVKIKNWAVLQVVNTIDFPIMLLERQDIIIMAFWIGSAFAFLNAGVFYTGTLLSQAGLGKERDAFFYWFSAAAVWAVSLYPRSMLQCMDILKRLRILNIIVCLAVIAAFIIVKGRRKNEK